MIDPIELYEQERPNLLDEFWKWYLATGKALLFSVLCGIHLLAMVLFEIAWNLFRVTKAARDYIEVWRPVRPEIFEFPRRARRESAT